MTDPAGEARRVRFWARATALVLALAGWGLGGPDGLAGVLWGGLVVELNLSLLVRTLARAPAWRGTSLKGTLASFYLAFAATALVCLLVIRQQWGAPPAFLAGLMSGFAGLVLALAGSGFGRLKRNRPG